MDSFKSKTMFYMLLVCALALPLIIGVSYAVYTVEEPEQKSAEKTQMKTSNLDVSFTANEYINQANGKLIKPEEVTDRADFSLFNIKSSKDTSNIVKYTILLTNIETSYDETTKTYPLMCEDFKWRLVKVTNDTETPIVEGTFKDVVTDSIELTKDIDLALQPGEEVTYKLYVWLEETTENQNALLNRTFKSKVTVNSLLIDEVTTTTSIITTTATNTD